MTYPESLFRYRLFGLHLGSRWAFPAPCQPMDGGGPADIVLMAGEAPRFSAARAEAGITLARDDWFQWGALHDGALYLVWPRLFEFVVSRDGRRIYCRQLGKSSWESFHSYLLGQVLSFALLKQGIESLHSTAIVLGQQAVGLIGQCGQGKSSLAAAFLKAGYPLLTDDLLALREVGHVFLAFPSFPRLKLLPRVARILLGEELAGSPMNPHTRKLIIPLKPGLHHPDPVPLKALLVLRRTPARSPRQQISIRSLSKRRAFLEVMASSFNTVVQNPDRIKRQFNWAAAITTAIPVKSLTYPSKLSRLPEVVAAIVANLWD